jgi:hypothetical protein
MAHDTKDTKASNLAGKVLDAKGVWENARLNLEKAKAEYDYAEQRLILARKELRLELDRADDPYYEMVAGFADPEGVRDAIRAVEYVGVPIGSAARSSLSRLKKATTRRLVSHMRERGFQFQTEAPARELHGAIVKQVWAKKDKKADTWEYVAEQ